MSEIERRTFAGTVEVRAADDGEPQHIEGYAAVFNQRSEVIYGFVEVINPGFFDDVLDHDVRALWNHDMSYVLGRTESGTLQVTVDAHGLRYRADPPDTQWARDAMVTMQRGDVSESSFGFSVARNGDRWEELEDGTVLRTLLKASDLYDVSPVTFPAYPQTSARIRARYDEFREFANAGQGPGDGSDGDGTGAQGRLGLQRRKLTLAEAEQKLLEDRQDED